MSESDEVLPVKCVPKSYSPYCVVRQATYLGRQFDYPIYTWDALQPFWKLIMMGITRILIYHRFSDNCYKDHKTWRSKGLRELLEPLRFADRMTRDRGVKRAVRQFNSRASLKYGEWMEPFWKETVNFRSQLAQFGQLIWNAMSFLKSTEYITVHKFPLGLNLLRPYWITASDKTLQDEWFVRTFAWAAMYEKKMGKRPSLYNIAQHWGVSRSTLIESDITRENLYRMFQYWKRYKTVKILKPKKEYRLPTPEELENIAKDVVTRVRP